jgi:hypothetical protein
VSAASLARRLGVAALLLGAAACATLAARKAVSDQDVIRMPHQKHRAADVDCEVCHARAVSSSSLEGRLLPQEQTCLKCHADWKLAGRCSACHLTEELQTWPPVERLVRFSHQDHLPQVGGDCARCHLELPEPSSPAKVSAPMGTCLSCHEHQRQYDQARCSTCHVDLTRLPLRPLAYFSHQGDYLREHRLPARTSPETCAQCHEPAFCADCHARTAATPVELKFPERVDRQFIHRNGYLGRHAIEARSDPTLCQRCHGPASCERCHQNRGVTPESKDPREPHPAGWSSAHGTAARRDIVSCAACHDQGATSNCVGCHRVGGPGGSPHPPSFVRSHTREDIRRQRMCLACHP